MVDKFRGVRFFTEDLPWFLISAGSFWDVPSAILLFFPFPVFRGFHLEGFVFASNIRGQGMITD